MATKASRSILDYPEIKMRFKKIGIGRDILLYRIISFLKVSAKNAILKFFTFLKPRYFDFWTMSAVLIRTKSTHCADSFVGKNQQKYHVLNLIFVLNSFNLIVLFLKLKKNLKK